MEKQHKFSIWYVLLGIWFVLILQNYMVSALAIKTIPYSEFLNLLKQDKIMEVAISSNQIEGKYREGKGDDAKTIQFKTVRVDPDTSKLLEQYHVDFKGEVDSHFLATLLSWIIPVFLFFGVWYFMMKRMAGQQPGFMTLGKNKAKIYMQEDIQVRFDDVAGVDEAKQEIMEVQIHRAGRQNSQGNPAGGATRHRQDPAQQSRGRGKRGALLQHERVGICRNVRRARGGPGSGSFRAGQAEGPLHYLH